MTPTRVACAGQGRYLEYVPTIGWSLCWPTDPAGKPIDVIEVAYLIERGVPVRHDTH